MNIGTAIKLIRKEKGLSQKDLAGKSDLSVNALSQIELNSAFPQKNTIHNICAALDIPVAYLLFFSINEEDVPQEKRKTFNLLNNAIKELLLDVPED
ncbi:MAG TPA: helix-turn-helix transcriptional regulator [Mucilaginibacter sp.]|nr:helix-turn-helix transcriptional regulator [Mucilaginibacter sp.]